MSTKLVLLIATLSCVAVELALMIKGFVQAYTFDNAESSRGAPPVTVMGSIVGLCIGLEVTIAIQFTSREKIVGTLKYRIFQYVTLALFGFFSMIFYAAQVNKAEPFGAGASIMWTFLSTIGLVNLKLVQDSTPDDTLAIKDAPNEAAECGCCENCNQACAKCACCGVGCCQKKGHLTACGMCLRWTLWVFAMLFFVQAAYLLSENMFLLQSGGATGGALIQLVPVQNGTLKLAFYCTGTKQSGDPVVLLEAGGGSGMGGMVPLMNELVNKNSMRVCIYDRPGYGFSQSSYPDVSAKQDTVNLAEGLQALGENGPFVCAGHSAGGTKCRALQYYYPAKVVGLVMMDAYCNNGPCNIEVAWDVALGRPDNYKNTYAMRLGMTDGLRFFTPFIFVRAFLAGGKTGLDAANYGGNTCWNAQYLEFRPVLFKAERDAQEVLLWHTPGVAGNVPLVIATAGQNSTCADHNVKAGNNCDNFMKVQNATTNEVNKYLSTSTMSKWVNCIHCDHGYVQDEPALAAAYVMLAVNAARNGGAFV